jgi:hypothetical protein
MTDIKNKDSNSLSTMLTSSMHKKSMTTLHTKDIINNIIIKVDLFLTFIISITTYQWLDKLIHPQDWDPLSMNLILVKAIVNSLMKNNLTTGIENLTNQIDIIAILQLILYQVSLTKIV